MRRLLLVLLIAAAADGAPVRLSLNEAKEKAVRNHPALQSAKALERAMYEIPKEVRARNYPQVTSLFTAVGVTDEASRIFAGGLTSPSLYNHAGAGVAVSQLLTDFGRTRNLVSSASLRARAQSEASNTTRAQILLNVVRAYFGLLRARAVLHVAEQTVSARDLVANQTSTLAQNKLKSELDVTFARVNLEDARLLLSNAQNDERSAVAELSEAMGDSALADYELTEEPAPAVPPADAAPLIRDALRNRPEAKQAQLEVEAAEKFAKAERALSFPTLSAGGSSGYAPYRPDRFQSEWATAGLNLEVPVFNGGLYSARHSEASARADSARQQMQEVNNRIARDVRVAYLGEVNADQRLRLTAQLLEQSQQSLKLAQARYDLGLGNIVELSQAQLNLTRAQIAQASARFDLQTQQGVVAYQTGALQ